jgi:GH15 family glucan-1,4-alpha-glucosidase
MIQDFPPISDYAAIGDGRTVALISREGSLEWLCLPDLDSPSVFASLLDRANGGSFDIRCHNGRAVGRRYRPNTNILETEYESDTGRLLLVDFMPIVVARDNALQPERELIRIVYALSGEPIVNVRYSPRPGYGSIQPRLRNRGQLGWALDGESSLTLLRSNIHLHEENNALIARTVVCPDKPAIFSLSYTRHEIAIIPRLEGRAEERLSLTENWWCDWSRACTYDGPYRDKVLRSALTLKLLQFCLSGAVAAAATTSLPEALDGARNWDYRYCWLRDASFMLRAFFDLGFWREGEAFFGWLTHSTYLTQPRLQPLYSLYGRTEVPERECHQLGGYANIGPVRIGNEAAGQFQLDVYGALVGAARDYIDRGHHFDFLERKLLKGIGDFICKNWQRPDSGIWEIRSERRHHTYSKASAWQALNDLVHLQRRKEIDPIQRKMIKARDEIRDSIMAHAISPRGSFKGAYEKDYIDASLLLLPRMGFCDANDPIMLATWNDIKDRLDDHGMIYRYEYGDDDISGHEGAFVICGFWAVDYLARAGRLEEAKHRFAQICESANDLGLMAEEYAPKNKIMLGNFPQAFSHAGLISAALAISNAEKTGQVDRAA